VGLLHGTLEIGITQLPVDLVLIIADPRIKLTAGHGRYGSRRLLVSDEEF